MHKQTRRSVLAKGVALGLCCFITVSTLIAEEVTVTAITEPVKDEIISSMVAGKIAKVQFEEGEKVKKGQVLIELKKKEHEFELQRRKLIWESKVKLTSAEARMKTYKKSLERSRQLYEETKSVSMEELDTKELEYKLAKAEWESLKIQEEREKIEYEIAREQVAKRTIQSPLNGVVLKNLYEVGETCRPHEDLMRIVRVDRFYAVANILPNQSARLELGMLVTFVIRQLTAEPIKLSGKISFISPVVDKASGLRRIRAVFDNADRTVPPGVSGQLKFSLMQE